MVIKKGDDINGYKLITEFTTLGGGMCRWAFATKYGKEYFLKEFLDPKYPLPDFPGSERRKKKMIKECELFENHQNKLISRLSKSVGSGGNIVGPTDFFLFQGCYYKITEKIDVSSLTVSDIAKLSDNKKQLILATIAHSIRTLHRLQIVHGDLKPGNILIKQVRENYVGKIIDMDNSYISKESPMIGHDTSVVGDIAYYSPELSNYVYASMEERTSMMLTIASDIFALGIIFHEYLTGLPPVLHHDYNYAWQAVNDKSEIELNTPSHHSELIRSMLSINPQDRPTAEEVFESIKSGKMMKLSETSTSFKKDTKVDTSKSRLVINMGDTKVDSSNNKGKLKINM